MNKASHKLSIFRFIASTLVVLTLCLSCKDDQRSKIDRFQIKTPGTQAQPPASIDAQTPIRWLMAGGGSTPQNNQYSIESDMLLALDVVGDANSRVLFAGGRETQGVLVRGERHVDPLRNELAMIFAPQSQSDATFRTTRLKTATEASAEAFKSTLIDALLDKRIDVPLTVYIATHGDRGETPADNAIALWGSWPLTVTELTELLDQNPKARSSRFVITACYGGGFADIVFKSADMQAGKATPLRCGLFATTWDREATGCDPNPDRSLHEGYAVYFFNALRGRDRKGNPVDTTEIDLNGDGTVGLSEAHAITRIHSQTIDIPTSTTERWLRHASLKPASKRVKRSKRDPAPFVWVEEDKVIAALAKQLGYEGNDKQAYRELESLTALHDDLLKQRQALAETEAELYLELGGQLLTHWPFLEDAWHPAFESMLRRNKSAINTHLNASTVRQDLQAHLEIVAELDERMHALEETRAKLERLVRALDNRSLASQLQAQGGDDWRYFLDLLACERSGM